jgi:hypothetical protein
MRVLRAEARAASIPAEVMKLIVTAAEIHLPDDSAILRRVRIKANDTHAIVLSILAVVKQRNIGETFWRGLHRHSWRRVKG